MASDGDGRMIAAARLRFSDYHFGGGTALFACVISSSPDEAGRRSFPLASCVVVPGRACLICPGVGDCVSSCLPVLVSFPGAVPAACVSLSSASLGVGYIPGSGHRSLIISSISSSRAAVAVSFSSTSGAASSIGGALLLSCEAIVRRTADVAVPSALASFSYELGKTARNVISCSSPSDVPGLLVLRLVLPSRGASRAVSSSRCSLVACVGSCGSVRRRLVVAEASFVCPAAWRYACPHPLPVASVRFSSLRLVWRLVARSPMSCGLGWRGVLAHPIGFVLLVQRGVPWCRGVLPCLPASSDLLFLCLRARRLVSRLGERLVGVSSSMMCPLRWRGVLAVPWASSRLIVSWSGEASASRFSSRRGADERWFPSCRLGAGACSDAVGDGAMLFSSSAFPIWFIVACFSFPVAIALASCRSFDSRRAGREAGRRLLAWILWRGSSCLVDGCI